MSNSENMNEPNAKDELLTLELLDAIEERGDLTQRRLAEKLGIALGLTNSYLRRCAKKGYVKVREVPANRYFYYLTPKGFTEKSRLTARFLSTSLAFYRQAAESCNAVYEYCDGRQWDRVLLCGISDLTDIAYMRSILYKATVVGVYDPSCEGGKFGGLCAWRQWEQTAVAEVYVVTDLSDPLNTYWNMQDRIRNPERVLAPSILGVEGAIQNR